MSSEIVLPKLNERLMTISLENAGADRGLLILPVEDDYLLDQAEAEAAGDRSKSCYAKSQSGGSAVRNPSSAMSSARTKA